MGNRILVVDDATFMRMMLKDILTKNDYEVAPSIQNKIDTHLSVVSKVTEILPISNIVVETASFDIQKIKNPDISGVEYQQGEQLGFWNVREYVLHIVHVQIVMHDYRDNINQNGRII